MKDSTNASISTCILDPRMVFPTKNSLCSNKRDDVRVSLAAVTALVFSSTESSRGGTSEFSNSIFSQFR